MQDHKKAILVTSFGTSFPETLIKNIEAIEKEIESVFPEYEVRRAFTSQMVINKLHKRDGVDIDTVEEALKCLSQEGFKEVIVQPTHVIHGIEYDQIVKQCQKQAEGFTSLKIGRPLLGETDDLLQVINILIKEFAHLDSNQALVLMGHGSTHFANAAYAALDYAFKEQGYSNVFVGTVEAYPGIDQILQGLKQGDYKDVLITPLMVVAGDHAQNDMAGADKDSWQSALEAAGYKVTTVIKGLGEYSAIRSMYVEHIKAVL